jgi:predicted ATPase with chaperone activity
MRKPRPEPAQPKIAAGEEAAGDFAEVYGQEHVKRALELPTIAAPVVAYVVSRTK